VQIKQVPVGRFPGHPDPLGDLGHRQRFTGGHERLDYRTQPVLVQPGGKGARPVRQREDAVDFFLGKAA